MFCQNCGTEISQDAKFCPKCGQAIVGAIGASQPSAQQQAVQGYAAPMYNRQQQAGHVSQQSYGQPQPQQPFGQQQAFGQQQYGAAPTSQGSKRSVSPALIVAIAIAVVAIIVALVAVSGALSPKGSGDSGASSSAVQSTTQGSSSESTRNAESTGSAGSTGGASSSASPADASTAPSQSSSATGSSAASASTSSGDASSISADDARKQAIDKAFADGYQVFEGTLQVLSSDELASLQGVDPKAVGSIEGTYAVLVFDAQIQVSGMSGDGSGSRRQGATMLSVAEVTQYASKGDLDSWKAYDGQHIAIGAKAEDVWFPSDVSLPVGEPRTTNAIVLG